MRAMPERSAERTARSGAILSWLREREEEMAALVADLVAIPTENPPGRNYGACADFLEKTLRRAGLDCERFATSSSNDNRDDAPECLLAMYGSGERAFYFHGHYDVVPAQSREQFQPTRKGHFVFGRGSCDMKGGIVAMLYAILALKELGAKPEHKIVLTLVPNEETGGEGGTAWLARQGLLGRGGLGMLTAEPTSGVGWNANRGALSLCVRVFGKAAHVGVQHQGANAFERMHEVVHRLRQLKREVEGHITGFNIGSEETRNSILMLGGQSGGGTNFNVVPEQCWFTIDRRINPEENLATEKAKLKDVLEGCKREGNPLEWEILQEGNSASCEEKGRLGDALSSSVLTVTGEAARFEMCPGLLETRFYVAQGIPAFAYGPGLLSVAHGSNEYVDMRKVIDTAAIYALTALEVREG
jgi:succinyl-diaminopimelate desuccinylase